MERSKVKLTVIFLLAVLNLFLLSNVFLQYHQARVYEKTTREQVLVFLQHNGVTVAQAVVPWKHDLTTRAEELPDQMLPGQTLPSQGLPNHIEIQPARETATLLMDFVRGMGDLGQTCTEIKMIREGYQYNGAEERAVLTPMWQVETDNGTFFLDCAQGSLYQEEA